VRGSSAAALERPEIIASSVPSARKDASHAEFTPALAGGETCWLHRHYRWARREPMNCIETIHHGSIVELRSPARR
jgi:hypothetical protein